MPKHSSALLTCYLQYLSDVSKVGHFGGFTLEKKTIWQLGCTQRSLLYSSRYDFEEHKDMGKEADARK